MADSTDSPGVIARPPFLYLGTLIVALALHWFWPAPILDQATWAVVLGIVLGMPGIGLALWGRAAMVAAGTNIDPRKETTSIVTSGPFRFTRNPLYISLTLLYLGLTFGFDTWWGIALLVPLAVVMHFGVVLREERYLERKFGDTYRHYKRTVARYIG